MGTLYKSVEKIVYRKSSMANTCYYGAESIHNLVPRALPKITKPPLYQSLHRGAVKLDGTTGKLSRRTMGYAKTPLKAPEEFLKKNAQPELTKNTQKAIKYHALDKKPPVPSHIVDNKRAMSQKNFIKENATEIIKAQAKKPTPKYVDTNGGHVNDLIPSGLHPKYSKKSDYGKVPTYIIEKKKAEAEAQREYDAYVQHQMEQGSLKRLPDEERENLLNGLKTNWTILHHQYQGLSVVIDTMPKKIQKERLESEMKQIERDINLLEKYPTIYVQ